MQDFCICTLTHNSPDRAESLRLTIKTFIESYKGSKLKWYILVNVTNKDIDFVLEEAIQLYSELVDFEIHINNKNTGPGAGINKLNELSKDYKYSLFLEGDWICLPSIITGFSDNWLENSVKLLNENLEIDQVQLRRYLDDLDDRQYGFSSWLTPDNIEKEIENGDTFVILKEREYVNTPTIRRMGAYFEKGIFPLKEFYDSEGNSLEIKGNDEWGMAEIEATKNKLNGAWLKLGNFVHIEHFPNQENWKRWINTNKGCNKFKMPGKNSCKYGYMYFTESFCAICEKNKDYTDLGRHSQVWIEDVLSLIENKDLTDDEIFTKMIEITEDPVYDVRDYLNRETYRNLEYNRN